MMKTANKTFQMTWFCPDCGTKVRGSEREKKIYVGECSNCHVVMARCRMGRHHREVKMFSSQCIPAEISEYVLKN